MTEATKNNDDTMIVRNDFAIMALKASSEKTPTHEINIKKVNINFYLLKVKKP